MQLSLDNIYISARLQKKLDRIPMYPLTTVVAPAGYGKTTAVRWFREGLSKECMVLRPVSYTHLTLPTNSRV